MKENNNSTGRKRKYNEMTSERKKNVKNIAFQTKRNIKEEKKKLKKQKKENKSINNKCKQDEEGTSTLLLKSEHHGESKELSIDNVRKTKHAGDALKHDGDAPKHDGDDPKHGGDDPKHDGDAPKHDGDAAKHDGDAAKHDSSNLKLGDGNVKYGGVDNDSCTPRKKLAKRDMEVTTTSNISVVLDAKVPTTPVVDSSFNKAVDNFEASGINVYQFAESRAFEIMNLQHALKVAKFSQNSRVFQTLPRHMRRRAASHDIRRIPKRLRERAKKERVVPKKPPSRKYKRRPRNLMEEYNRRSKLHSWLETHMWHAKRFKMIDKWGYRVPEKPCDKAFRAMYRASAKSCLLQDKSYMEFIEIIGSEEVIINGFQRITNSNSIGGIKLNDEKCLSGEHYGEEIVYTHDSYPYHVIGCVKFIWGPAVVASQRKLIIICHPNISLEIMNELEEIFEVSKSDGDEASVVTGSSTLKEGNAVENIQKNLMESVIVGENVLQNIKEKVDHNNLIHSEIVRDYEVHSNLEENKERHQNKITDSDILDVRLKQGGESATTNKIVDDRLQKHDESVTRNKIKVVLHRLDFVMFSLTGPLSFRILQNVLTFPENGSDCNGVKGSGEMIDKEEGDGKRTYWNVSDATICKQECALYNLSAEDPRFHIPYKKRNPFSLPKIESTSTVPTSSHVSLIWNESSRKKIKDAKLSDEQINDIRHQQLIPGSKLPVTSVEIPLVVMQRPSRSLQYNLQDQQKYGCGFDIILPSGWAMPFWIALVYQGACVGGVEADENIALEALSTHFPTQYPDSKARQEHVTLLHEEKLQKHKRYPPDKRMNYDKLGFKHPFTIPWLHLVAEWKNIIKLLMHEDSILENIQFSKCDQNFYVLRERNLLYQLKMLLSGECKDKERIINNMLRYPDGVLLVNVSPLQGGIPKENATLCIPTGEDIALLNVRKTSTGEVDGWTEPRHKGCKREFPYICKKYNILLPNAATIGGNTRWIVGYVQNGAYSFTKGKGSGVGFISIIGLVYLLYVNKVTKLLFRNVNTLEYLFCSFDILL